MHFRSIKGHSWVTTKIYSCVSCVVFVHKELSLLYCSAKIVLQSWGVVTFIFPKHLFLAGLAYCDGNYFFIWNQHGERSFTSPRTDTRQKWPMALSVSSERGISSFFPKGAIIVGQSFMKQQGWPLEGDQSYPLLLKRHTPNHVSEAWLSVGRTYSVCIPLLVSHHDYCHLSSCS